jgi:hypothetical protein
MKKLLLIALFACFGVSSLLAQVSFSVSPGLASGGSFIGYKFNNFVPYIGLQYLGAGLTFEETGFEYKYPSTVKTPYSYKDEVSANIYMPQIGVKYFFNDTEDIRLYLNACFNYAFISANAKNEGIEDKSVKNTVDNLNVLGVDFGVGAEYFFSKKFSIGGEFDLRMLFAGSKYSDQTTIYNPNTQTNEDNTINYDINMNLGVTSSKLTLNYYF